MITTTYIIDREDGTRERIVSIQTGEGGIADRAIRFTVGVNDKLTVETRYEPDKLLGVTPKMFIVDDFAELEKRVLAHQLADGITDDINMIDGVSLVTHLIRQLDSIAERRAAPVLTMAPVIRPYGKSYRRRGPPQG